MTRAKMHKRLRDRIMLHYYQEDISILQPTLIPVVDVNIVNSNKQKFGLYILCRHLLLYKIKYRSLCKKLSSMPSSWNLKCFSVFMSGFFFPLFSSIIKMGGFKLILPSDLMSEITPSHMSLWGSWWQQVVKNIKVKRSRDPITSKAGPLHVYKMVRQLSTYYMPGLPPSQKQRYKKHPQERKKRLSKKRGEKT